MGDLIAGLLFDCIRHFVWGWLLMPALTTLLVRPLRWLVVRPVRRHLAKRRCRRERETHQGATALSGD